MPVRSIAQGIPEAPGHPEPGGSKVREVDFQTPDPIGDEKTGRRSLPPHAFGACRQRTKLAYEDEMDLARPVHTRHQGVLNVRRAAGS